MIIQDTIINADGTVKVREVEVADNYFDLPEPPPPTIDERVTLLTAQLKAAQESNAFLEDCLVEMAEVVYA